ncbi:MAG: hypothetical protein JNK88_09690 [Mangrovicoccus sp.]|nr:hypothetical protein [Mangrovicoccus sp.]
MQNHQPRRRPRNPMLRLVRTTLIALLFLGYGAGSTVAVVTLVDGASIVPAHGAETAPDPDWALVSA